MADFTANNVTDTSSIEHLAARAVDHILTWSPLPAMFLSQQMRWSGKNEKIPVKYAKNSNGRWFTGLEKFSTVRTNNFINMVFNPVGREQPTVIAGIERDVAGTNKLVDIRDRQLKSDTQDMADTLADAFYTAQTGNAFLSLLDAVDDSTISVSSYGGLSKSTYTGVAGNVTASIGALSLNTLASMYMSASHGAMSPDFHVTTKSVWQYYENKLLPTFQHNAQTSYNGYAHFMGASKNGRPNVAGPGEKLSGFGGFNALYYKGAPVVADEHCTAGYWYGLYTPSWAFYGLESQDPDYKPVTFTSRNLDGIYDVPTNMGFNFSGYNKPIDQYGEVGHIILMGNFICNHPRVNFLGAGITS